MADLIPERVELAHVGSTELVDELEAVRRRLKKLRVALQRRKRASYLNVIDAEGMVEKALDRERSRSI